MNAYIVKHSKAIAKIERIYACSCIVAFVSIFFSLVFFKKFNFPLASPSLSKLVIPKVNTDWIRLEKTYSIAVANNYANLSLNSLIINVILFLFLLVFSINEYLKLRIINKNTIFYADYKEKQIKYIGRFFIFFVLMMLYIFFVPCLVIPKSGQLREMDTYRVAIVAYGNGFIPFFLLFLYTSMFLLSKLKNLQKFVESGYSNGDQGG